MKKIKYMIVLMLLVIGLSMQCLSEDGDVTLSFDNIIYSQAGSCPDGYLVQNTTAEGVECAYIGSTNGSSGNPFNQDLNTFDSPEFNNMNIDGTLRMNGMSGYATIQNGLMRPNANTDCSFPAYGFYTGTDSDFTSKDGTGISYLSSDLGDPYLGICINGDYAMAFDVVNDQAVLSTSFRLYTGKKIYLDGYTGGQQIYFNGSALVDEIIHPTYPNNISRVFKGYETVDLGEKAIMNGSIICTANNNQCIMIESDPIFMSQNASLARIGNCPSGYLIQNVTPFGVQCIIAANSSINESWMRSVFVPYYNATNDIFLNTHNVYALTLNASTVKTVYINDSNNRNILWLKDGRGFIRNAGNTIVLDFFNTTLRNGNNGFKMEDWSAGTLSYGNYPSDIRLNWINGELLLDYGYVAYNWRTGNFYSVQNFNIVDGDGSEDSNIFVKDPQDGKLYGSINHDGSSMRVIANGYMGVDDTTGLSTIKPMDENAAVVYTEMNQLDGNARLCSGFPTPAFCGGNTYDCNGLTGTGLCNSYSSYGCYDSFNGCYNNLECSYFSESECNGFSPDCTSNYQCIGTYYGCEYFDNENDCNTHSAMCAWVSQANICVNIETDCTTLDLETCNSYPEGCGVSFLGCSGTKSCVGFDENTCIQYDNIGCDYDYVCAGSGNCIDVDQGICNDFNYYGMGCEWQSESFTPNCLSMDNTGKTTTPETANPYQCVQSDSVNGVALSCTDGSGNNVKLMTGQDMINLNNGMFTCNTVGECYTLSFNMSKLYIKPTVGAFPTCNASTKNTIMSNSSATYGCNSTSWVKIF